MASMPRFVAASVLFNASRRLLFLAFGRFSPVGSLSKPQKVVNRVFIKLFIRSPDSGKNRERNVKFPTEALPSMKNVV